MYYEISMFLIGTYVALLGTWMAIDYFSVSYQKQRIIEINEDYNLGSN
jgi:hypothetical protein